MRRALIALALTIAVVLPGCGGDDDDDDGVTVDISDEDFQDHTGETSVAVDAVDNRFRAQYIEVSAGTAVTFKNDGRNDHNVLPATTGTFTAIETADFTPGDEGTIVFEQPGDYAYYCSLHATPDKGMIGGIRAVE